MKKKTGNLETIIRNSVAIQERYRSQLYTIIDIREYKCIFPFNNCCVVIFNREDGKSDSLFFEVCEIINNEVGKHFSLLPSKIDNEKEILNGLLDVSYNNGIFLKQVSRFKILNVNLFQYDFNHDGVDDFLWIGTDYIENFFSIDGPKLPEFKYHWILSFRYNHFSEYKLGIEFINYKFRQGIKFYTGEEYLFYYYDRVQQKYVQDTEAASDELEKIHGSPDFFAEAGIDFLKLERPLVESDLEGFSKAALRIWRNAVYARRGRTFQSEDLQALFNEYVWYKPDEEYSDEKLSEIDWANIQLISRFEKNIE